MQIAQNAPTIVLEYPKKVFQISIVFFLRMVINGSDRKNIVQAYASVIVKSANLATVFAEKQKKTETSKVSLKKIQKLILLE